MAIPIPDAEWPNWARVSGAITLADQPDVLRTQLDDGYVRQARRYSMPWLTQAVTAQVPGERLEEWQAWVRQYGAGWFRFAGPDGRTRAMRIQGGAGGVRIEQVRRGEGVMLWDATLTLEGPAAPIFDPNLWAADVALGHASHVYARSRIATRAERRSAGSYQILVTPSPVQRLDPVFFAGGTAAAYIAGMWARRGLGGGTNLNFRLSLDPASGYRDTNPGPDLLTAALPGLTHVFRLGVDRPIFLSGGTGGAVSRDESDPYGWTAAADGPFAALVSAVIAAGTEDPNADPPAVTGDQSLISWALVWSGAGSVVDLAQGYTRGGGAAPVIATG